MMHFQKTYLSRAMTRAMASEYPIGDPHGGAAYGEKNDAVSAVLSIGAMIMSVPTGGFAAMSLLQGLTFAGAAVSLVGNLTGNKTLSNIGSVASMAGGIGQFAQSLGVNTGVLGQAGGVGNLFGGQAPTVGAQAVGNLAPVQNGQIVDDVAAAASRGAASASPASMIAPDGTVTYAPSMLTSGSQPSGILASNINVPSVGLDGAPQVTPSLLTSGGGSAVGNINPAMADLTGSLTGTSPAAGGLAAVNAPTPELSAFEKSWEAIKSAGKSVDQFVKENPTSALALGKGLEKGLDFLSGKSAAEINQLEADAAYRQAKADEVNRAIEIEKEKRARLNAGYLNVNQNIPINTNATLQPQVRTPQPAPQGQMQPAPQGQPMPQQQSRFQMIPNQGLITNAMQGA